MSVDGTLLCMRLIRKRWALGGLIGSGLTALDLRETSPISSPVHFSPFLHKYVTSLAPLLLTLPAFTFSAFEPLLRTESAGEKKG